MPIPDSLVSSEGSHLDFAELECDAHRIEENATVIAEQAEALSQSVSSRLSTLIAVIKNPCDTAVANVVLLGDIVRAVAHSPDPLYRKDLITAARETATEAHLWFKLVHELARESMEDANDASTELVYWLSKADSHISEVISRVTFTKDMLEGLARQRDIAQDEVNTYLKDIQNAEAAQKSAESKLEELRVASVIRYVPFDRHMP
jgi:hypothetical protein